jgi:hypothetical protein
MNKLRKNTKNYFSLIQFRLFIYLFDIPFTTLTNFNFFFLLLLSIGLF